MPEIIKNGKNGFLVKSLNDAVEAVEKIKSIDRMKCRKKVIEHFTVNRMTDDYINIYEEIVNKSTSKSIIAGSQDMFRNIKNDSMDFKQAPDRNSN